MEKEKEKLENFKTAISSTVRSLSNSKKIEVFFGNQSLNKDKSSIKLPEIINDNNTINFEEIRAIADSKSLKLRFSDKDIFKKYEPDGNVSKKLYSIAEKLDVKKLEQVILKVLKTILKNFTRKEYQDLILKAVKTK